MSWTNVEMDVNTRAADVPHVCRDSASLCLWCRYSNIISDEAVTLEIPFHTS